MTQKNNKLDTEAIEPMLVSESGDKDKAFNEIMRLHGKTYAEVKSDGYRVQVHKSNGSIKLYTRNLNYLNPDLFPELKKQFSELPCGIFDGELVGLEDGVRGFESVSRRMKNPDSEIVEKYPLNIKFFDILKLDDKVLVNEPLKKRRKILEEYVSNVSDKKEISNAYELKKRFEEVTGNGLEGIVCKNPESRYHAGKRTKDWVKIKKFLTLDLVILGLYKGEGKAAKLPFAAMLLGVKNKDIYESIAKVGISNKEMIDSIYSKIKKLDRKPKNVVLSKALKKKTYSRKAPFCYISPENSVVVEVEALNVTRSENWHSCGLQDSKAYSLRIPIVKKVRQDKNSKDCTTTKQIKELYHY